MKIIFSPSKKQNRSSEVFDQISEPMFSEQAQEVRASMQKFSKTELQKILKLSDAQVDSVFDLYHGGNLIQSAVCLFSGTSFAALDVPSLSHSQIDYLQQYLRIMSAMYGVLQPLDQVVPYRLDMNDRIFTQQNLYDFWKPCLEEYFDSGELIINLASAEYTKMIPKNCRSNMIDCIFYIRKENALRSVSVFSKQQRGNLLRYMAQNHIADIGCVKKYSDNGFVFSSELSDDKKYIWVKDV